MTNPATVAQMATNNGTAKPLQGTPLSEGAFPLELTLEFQQEFEKEFEKESEKEKQKEACYRMSAKDLKAYVLETVKQSFQAAEKEAAEKEAAEKQVAKAKEPKGLTEFLERWRLSDFFEANEEGNVLVPKTLDICRYPHIRIHPQYVGLPDKSGAEEVMFYDSEKDKATILRATLY